MHQPLHRFGHEAVVDEEVFFNSELCILPFKVSGTLVFDAMAQDQILRAGRGADRIRLYEAERLQSAS